MQKYKTLKNNALFQHAISLSIAAFLATSLYWLIDTGVLRPRSSQIFIPNIGKGTEAQENLIELRNALTGKNSLVLLGSSELTNREMENIPYTFIPEKFGTPVLAYGHALFQSFPMYGLLAANADSLSARTRLVIIASPSWFKESAIPSGTFLEHFSPAVLPSVYKTPVINLLTKKYIEDHVGEFSGLDRQQKAFLANDADEVAASDRFMLQARMNNQLSLMKRKLSIMLGYPNRVIHPGHIESTHHFDWESGFKRAQAAELSHMHNNSMFVRDDYFEKYLKDKKESELYYFPKDGSIEPEMSMFSALVAFLKEKKVHALIIMQPINPYVYKDAAFSRTIGERVSAVCASNNMAYYDMTKINYEPGILRDSMHFGEYGWSLVNKRIMQYLSE